MPGYCGRFSDMANILDRKARPEAPRYGEENFDIMQCRMPHGDLGPSVIDHMNEGHRPGIEWAIAQIPDIDPEFILDIGYGGGIVSRLILRRFTKARGYGIDISEVSYQYASEYDRYFIDEGRLRLIIGDVHDMPYEDGKFGLVISNASYFFWEDIGKAFKEIGRVMAEGATICIPDGKPITDDNYEEAKANAEPPMNVYKDSEMIAFMAAAGIDAKRVVSEDGEMGAFIGVKRRRA
jgi:SAM-dependent methyltransferase